MLLEAPDAGQLASVIIEDLLAGILPLQLLVVGCRLQEGSQDPGAPLGVVAKPWNPLDQCHKPRDHGEVLNSSIGLCHKPRHI